MQLTEPPYGLGVSVKRNWQAHDKPIPRIAGQRYGRRMRRPYTRKFAKTRLGASVANRLQSLAESANIPLPFDRNLVL